MISRRMLLLAAVTAIPLLGLANAAPTPKGGGEEMMKLDLTPVGKGMFYVASDGIWQETNSVRGLQRIRTIFADGVVDPDMRVIA